jgi:phosphatidylserine/phosphatidylglycerophosphate/cardiolipin synthase-like enzyme
MAGKQLSIAIILFGVLSTLSSNLHAYDLTLNSTPAQVYFAPDGACTKAIIREIDNATMEILVQTYSFASAPVAKALVTAKRRAVNIEVMLHKDQKKEKQSSATFLTNAQVPTYIDSAHTIAYNKIIIIDKETVISGSFNFTKAADGKNTENLLIIRNKDLALLYIDNWLKHKKHSVPYKR